MFKQPIFGNLLVTNPDGNPLGVNGLPKGCAFAIANCTRLKDFWETDVRKWKSLSSLRMHFHATNRASREIITVGIHWNPVEYPNHAQVGDWIYNRSLNNSPPLD